MKYIVTLRSDMGDYYSDETIILFADSKQDAENYARHIYPYVDIIFANKY